MHLRYPSNVLIPHFETTGIDGEHVRYRDFWQRRNVVLLALGPTAGKQEREYASRLRARLLSVDRSDTAFAAIGGAAVGLTAPTLIVADRWGEIVHSEELPADVSRWPSADEVLDWVTYVRCRCEECLP